MKNRTKAILVDILGFTLILAAIPLGWLPGPGGIPLIILGLSLLANNHEWAERWLDSVKQYAHNASKKVSEASPVTKWAIDIASIVFIATAVILITQVTKSVAKTAAISLIIVGITLLITNRERHLKLWNKIRHKHKR